MKKKGNDEKKKGKQVVSVATSSKIGDISGKLEEEEFVMISHFS